MEELLQVRISKELKEKLNEKSRKEQLNISQVIRILVRKYVESELKIIE